MKKIVEKVCPVCSKGFQAQLKRVYCSDSCANFARNERAKKQYKDGVLRKKKCRVCGKIFETNTRRLTCCRGCQDELRIKAMQEREPTNGFWEKIAESIDRHEAISYLKRKYKLDTFEAENKYNAWRNNYIKDISL